MQTNQVIPPFLYHKVLFRLPKDEMSKCLASIWDKGILPYSPSEWKSLLPDEMRETPIVWLANGIWAFDEGVIIEIDTSKLERKHLHSLNLQDVDWWVYSDTIPVNAFWGGHDG